jgi:phasin family protein
MAQMSSTILKSCEEMSNVTNSTLNAAMKSTAVLAKGYEELFSNIANIMKTSFENNISACKAVMSATSVTDAMNAQACALKSNADYLISQSNKLSEISTRMTQEVVSPLTEQVNTAMTMASKWKAA